jgi:ribosomal protein L16 Arg81 hydroxylase
VLVAFTEKFELSHLLGLNTSSEFFDQIWERRALLAQATLKDIVDDVLTLNQYEELISYASKGGEIGLSIVEDSHALPVKFGHEYSPTLSSIFEAYRRGCTLLLSNIQKRWTPIANICRQLENIIVEQGIPLADDVVANGYLTPPNCQGFDIHYDDHCVLIIQLKGNKNWIVYPPLEDYPIERCRHPLSHENLERALIEKTLAAGDVLYIPRGFPHKAHCTDENSLHITLSLNTLKWKDVIGEFFAEQSAFRKSIRLETSENLLVQRFHEKALATHLKDIRLGDIVHRKVSDCLVNMKPILGKRFEAIDAINKLDKDTKLGRTAQVHCSVYANNEKVTLCFPGNRVSLSIEMKPVFEFIVDNMIFTVNQMPRIEPDFDAIALMQNLIVRGLLLPIDLMFQE